MKLRYWLLPANEPCRFTTLIFRFFCSLLLSLSLETVSFELLAYSSRFVKVFANFIIKFRFLSLISIWRVRYYGYFRRNCRWEIEIRRRKIVRDMGVIRKMVYRLTIKRQFVVVGVSCTKRFELLHLHCNLNCEISRAVFVILRRYSFQFIINGKFYQITWLTDM